MFQSSQRLKKTKEISKVFKFGKSCFLPGLGIKAYENNQGLSRATILVSKKVSRSAVERNRLKRQIRSILKTELKDKTPCDLIVICQPGSLKFDFAKLEYSIKSMVAKLKI